MLGQCSSLLRLKNCTFPLPKKVYKSLQYIYSVLKWLLIQRNASQNDQNEEKARRSKTSCKIVVKLKTNLGAIVSITKLVVAAECVIAMKFYFFYSTSWRLYHKIILGCTGYVISVVRNSFLIDYTFFFGFKFPSGFSGN